VSPGGSGATDFDLTTRGSRGRFGANRGQSAAFLEVLGAKGASGCAGAQDPAKSAPASISAPRNGVPGAHGSG
jgi:hypothetical protein